MSEKRFKKKVIVIPAKLQKYKKLKVVQRRSLDYQIKSYTKMVTENPDWIYAGIFYDVGKSGLGRSGRTGLDRLLKKAEKGKIDYIITKSISRISRDTVEILKIVRYLSSIRAEHGEQTLKQLSKELTKEFGRGFSRSNIQNMRAIYINYDLCYVLKLL